MSEPGRVPSDPDDEPWVCGKCGYVEVGPKACGNCGAPGRVSSCHIKGPYYPVGDIDWECVTHGVEAVLRDPSRYGAGDLRRADFACPVSTARGQS